MWTSRHLALQSPLGDKAKLSTEEALYLATRGGAAVVGIADKVGGFDVGKEFDAQVIDLGAVREGGENEGVFETGPVDVFGWESWGERVEKWVYAGDDRNTTAVWVRGRVVHATKRFEGVVDGAATP